MPVDPLIPAYVSPNPSDIQSLIAPDAPAFTILVATSGEGSDADYNGSYAYIGVWGDFGKVFAKVGSTIEIDGEAITGAGAAFLENVYGGTPRWNLVSSSDWGSTSPNDYLYDADEEASREHPGLVPSWINPNDYEFEVSITAVPIPKSAITPVLPAYVPSVPSEINSLL